MSKYWSPFVKHLVPYVPGEQPKIDRLIKLNTNENPYGPSPRVLQAIQAEVGEGLRRYPDPSASLLVDAAARFFGVTREHVFAGNGSDEVLAHAFHGLMQHGSPVLFPDISYSFYPVYCGLYGVPFDLVPLNERFEIDLDDYARPNGGVIFPNPNAPTGVAVPLRQIEALLERNTESVVIVDEAYVDFGAESAVKLVARYPQLLVVQTLSKSRSLAGLRVGLGIGHPALIEALVRIKDSFNSYPLDRMAIVGAAASLDDVDTFERTCSAVVAHREVLVSELSRLGFEVLPSAANFVFARHPAHEGAALAAALRARAVLVRHFQKPRIHPFLRITVGLPDENASLIAALDEILAPA